MWQGEKRISYMESEVGKLQEFEKRKELRKMKECEKKVVLELLMASEKDGRLNAVKVLKNDVEEK